MNFIKNSVIAKVVSVSIISISISMAILTFLVVNNSFDMMKTNTEKTVQKELSLLIENINTFNKVAKSGVLIKKGHTSRHKVVQIGLQIK